MYKRIALWGILASQLLVFGAAAQTKTKGKVSNEFFNITFGSKLQLDKEFRPQKLLPRPEGGFLIQSFGKGEKSMGIDIVNGEFQQTQSKMHDVKKEYDRRDENILYFGGKAFWVSSSVEPKSKTDKAYLQGINDQNGDFEGDEIEINKTNDVWSGLEISFNFFAMMGGGGSAAMVLEQSDRYNYSVSPDSTKLLIYYRKKPLKKLNKVNKDVYGFIVISDDFKVLWKKEVEMPKTEFMMSFYEAEVSNEGNVYYLAKVYKDEVRKYKKTSKPNYTLSVFEVSKDSKKSKERAIEMTDGFLRETAFFIEGNGDAVVCGTYSKLNKGSGASGVFYKIVDMEERKNGDASYVDFDSDLDANFEGPKHAKNLKKIYKKYGSGFIPYLQFREVFYNQRTKALYLVLESYHLVIRSTNNGRTQTYYYYYDDVYAVKINTEKQQIDKAYKIPKRQLGINIRVDLGISSFMFDEELYVFFIDNKKNLELKEDMVPAEHRSTAGGFLSGVRLDFGNDEGPQRFLLYDAKVEKKYCDPRKFVTSDGVIYGVGYEKAKGGGPYYPIKISFKD